MIPWQRQWAFGLYCAFIAAIIAFVPLANATYIGLFMAAKEGEPGRIQQDLPVDLPTPAKLAWSDFTVTAIEAAGKLTSAGALAVDILLFGILAHCFLRIVNPTFCMTKAIEAKLNRFVRTHMFTPPIIKVILISVASAIPVFVFMMLTDWLLSNFWLLWTVRGGVLGAAAFVLFSRNGCLADCDGFHYRWPEDRRAWASLLLRGCLCGWFLAALALLAGAIDPQEQLLIRRAIGAVGEASWRVALGWVVAPAALMGFAGAGAVVALGTPQCRVSKRVVLMVLPAACLALSYWIAYPLQATAKSMKDYPMPHMPHTQVFQAKVSAGNEPAVPRTAFLLTPEGVVPLRISGKSLSGLPATQQAAANVRQFLESRNQETALNTLSLFTLHDVATLSLDPANTLKVELENLKRNPDTTMSATWMATLKAAGASPEARKAAKALADPNLFIYQDEKAITATAMVFARLGMRTEAEQWFKKANVPASRLPAVLSDTVMFCEGEIVGTLKLQGKPASGTPVAAIPLGAMRDLQGSVIPGFGLNPFWLRWVSASALCDVHGKFRIQNLVAGNYLLLVMASDQKMRSFSTGVRVKSTNPAFNGDAFIAFGSKRVDAGTLDITWSQQEILTGPMRRAPISRDSSSRSE